MNTIYSFHDVFDQERVLKRIIEFEPRLNDPKVLTNRFTQSVFIIDNIPQAVFVTDLGGNIKLVNASAERITGYLFNELFGKNMRILKSERQDRSFYLNMWKSVLEEGYWQGEIWNRKKNGEIYPEWLNLSIVKDSTGKIINYVALFSDISEVVFSASIC